jgi:signal transduction histidine kinase
MMRTLRLLYLLSIALIVPAWLCARGYEGWTVTNYNNENGLPQSSVTFAEIDNDGYLWMATQAGIVRYDGRRFRLFDNTNSSLLRNRYTMLGKDDSGRIYCIDDGLKISFYNNRTGFSKPRLMPNMVPTTDGGIIDLNRLDMGKLAPFAKTTSYRNYSYEFRYHSIDNKEGFLILCYTFAGYVSNGKVQRVDSLDLYKGKYYAIGCVGNKLCYISKNGDFILVGANGVRSHQKIPFAVPWNKLGSKASYVSFFRQKNQLLLNMDGDIYEVKLAGDELQFHHIIRVKDIPYICCIRYYPEQDLLIIGSNTKGVFLFKKQQLASIGKNPANPNAFYALAPYGNNQVIATTGILPYGRLVPGIVDDVNRFSILRDRNRHYWYGNLGTLLETDDQFRVLKRIPLDINKRMECVREDEQGTIWLSQGEDNFGRVQADTFQPYKLEGIEGKGIQSLIPAGNQTFWLVGGRLCLWLDVKHRRQRIYHEFDNIDLRTVYLDKQGNLWVGSYGQGYFLFRNGRFTKMPEDEAKYLKVVHCFLEDRKGFIWMTTNNGLFQCAVNDLYRYAAGSTRQVYHHYYGKESGLKASEFNGGCTPSGLELDNGLFAFPSMDGVVLFHPDSIKPELPAGKLFIEQILLDGMPVKEAGLSKISPSFKRLELAVSSPYFGNPNNLNIEYNIDGLDDRWYPLGENNRIVLNRLKYGHYKVRLRKEAGFGPDNYITIELPLLVTPFFYQTWWFRILIGIGIVLLILLIIKLRYKYLIRQRNRLEVEVTDRTSALVYHNKLMEKLTVMIAHDLKSPLHFLSKVTGHLRKNVQQENLQGIDRTSNEIKNTADQIYQFVEEFNLWASSFNEGFSINKTSFALDGLLQELGLFFKEMLEANGNKLVMATATNYILDTDRELLKVILRNIIDNANKHTSACDISISAHAETEQYIAITITDTGEGMSEPVLKRIHERIAQAYTAASIERNSRMGYQMIIDFAARLEAKLDVQSGRGKGTSVTLHIRGKIIETSSSQDLAQQVVCAG